MNNKEIMKSEKLISSKWNNINHFNIIIREFQKKERSWRMKSTWNHSLEKRKGWGERMKIIMY